MRSSAPYLGLSTAGGAPCTDWLGIPATCAKASRDSSCARLNRSSQSGVSSASRRLSKSTDRGPPRSGLRSDILATITSCVTWECSKTRCESGPTEGLYCSEMENGVALVMNNPWLEIPADDYVGHMSSPEVGQYQLLNLLMRDILDSTRPRTLLVLGCSMGNGFEHIDPHVTSRVVGVDINPLYLERLVEKFPHPDFLIDVRCADLTVYPFEPDAFDLFHAALGCE